MKPLTIKEVRARYNQEKPKFIGLKNSQGEWVVSLNTPKIKPDDRKKEMEKFFLKTSVPDGIYFFISKESLMKNTPEYVTEVVKGDPRNLPALQDAPKVTIQKQATQDVWDMNTALDKETQIIRLTFRNTYLEEEILELKARIRELEAELATPLEDDQDKKSETKDLMDGVKSILEMVTPVVDDHFKLRREELAVKKQQLGGHPGASGAPEPKRLQQTATMRGDGGVPVSDPGYEEYFANVVENAPQELLDLECDYLESVDPQLYQTLWDKYNPEEPEEENGSGA